MKRIVFFPLLLILLLAACLPSGTQSGASPGMPAGTLPAPAPEHDPAPEPAPEPEPSVITLVAVGDCLSHNTVVKAAKKDGGYDFSPFFSEITPLIAAADIAAVNIESPLGGPDYPPTGYPRFNAPQALGRDLVDAGFNVFSHANNHAMDSGEGAALDTIAFWETYRDKGILMTGYYKDAEDRDELRVMEKNGVRVGFLSYTYGTNSLPLPKGNPDLVPLIDKERMAHDLNRLVPACDLAVVIIHWGREYTHEPSDEQKELASYLTELGADLIIGHHPHVIQPAEWVETENGRAFCAYSLGNFLSSQNKPATMLEGMLQVKIVKQPDGATSLEEPSLLPLVNYYDSGWKTFRIYPLYAYTDKLAETHRVSRVEKLTPSYFSELARAVYGEFLTEGRPANAPAPDAPAANVPPGEPGGPAERDAA